MSRSPVAHHDPAESPFFSGDGFIQQPVLGHVYAIHQVVGIHQRAHLRFFYRGFKRREIDFPHGPLIQIRAVIHAAVLRIIGDEMFRRRHDPLRLNALNNADGRA